MVLQFVFEMPLDAKPPIIQPQEAVFDGIEREFMNRKSDALA